MQSFPRGYLTNIFLYISYSLPGVFENNTYPIAVNGSIWSLPVEFSMYLFLAIFGLIKIPRAGLVAFVLILMLLSVLWAMKIDSPVVFYRTDVRQVVMLGVYFWVGVLLYIYRAHRFFTLTNSFLVIVIWLSLSRWPNYFNLAAWLALPFLVLAFGLSRDDLISKLTRFDYSYGIYIYAFPVQQTISMYWPKMNTGAYVLLTGSITIFLAALSWHYIEHPALNLKPKVNSK